MDEMSNKAITIGVAIFITITIVSGVFYVINQMKTIYEQVYEIDISIQSMFSEFDMYDNTEKTGIDVLNAIKKYKDNPNVNVYIGNKEAKTLSIYTNYINYKNSNQDENLKNHLTSIGEKKYISTINLDEATGITTITFN